MTIPTHAYQWEQGTDLVMKLVYRTGADVNSMLPVDLTGYSVRMDLRASSAAGALVYTFNSADITDVDPLTPGSQPDTTHEAVLGADGSINISVPKELTLPSGAVYAQMNLTPPVTVFVYDIILRDGAGKQSKILSGTVTVNASVTLWI